mgnify:CR=1 FL=1
MVDNKSIDTKKKDFIFFQYVPQIYLMLSMILSFTIIVFKIFSSSNLISIIVSLIILITAIYLIRRNVINALKYLDKRGNYYVAEDFIARSKRLSGRLHDVKVFNACVPIVPGLDVIVVSRSLAEALGEGELSAVVKHEEGHVRYRHVPFITVSLASLYFTYYIILKTVGDYLGLKSQPGISFVIALGVGVPLGLLLIHTVMRGLEREADHHVVISGYSNELRSALSKIPHRTGLLNRLFDPHPIYYARPSELRDFDRLSWHVRLISPLIFLMSLSLTVYIAVHLTRFVRPMVVVMLSPAILFTVFIVALFIAYVVMYMHNALGIKPWDSRVMVITYYLITLMTILLKLGFAGFVTALIISPLVVYRNLREYLISLVPFLIIAVLNMVAVAIIYGLLHLLAIHLV